MRQIDALDLPQWIATGMVRMTEVMGDEDPRRAPSWGFLIDGELPDPAFVQPAAWFDGRGA